MFVSIVVPAHNEEGNINSLVTSLQKMLAQTGLKAEIILVDDNSSDRTGEMADSLSRKFPNVKAIHRKGSRGMGNTLMEGTRAAKGPVVVWTMADLSDDPYAIPKMVEKIASGYDMVFGSRYMRGGDSGDLSRIKAFNSRLVSRLAFFFIGTMVHDITNAFRGFRKEVFEKATPKSGDFAISPEFALRAQLAGFRLGEVPVTYRNRISGTQKFQMYRMGRRYAYMLAKAFLVRLRISKFR